MHLILVASLIAGTHTASFDCKKASSKSEKLICAKAGLAGLDGLLAMQYGAMLKVSGAADEIKSEQVAWLKERNACADAGCVEWALFARLQTLATETITTVTAQKPLWELPADKGASDSRKRIEVVLAGTLAEAADQVNLLQGERVVGVVSTTNLTDPQSAALQKLTDGKSKHLLRGTVVLSTDGGWDFDDAKGVAVY